jgi:hypothetical protein
MAERRYAFILRVWLNTDSVTPLTLRGSLQPAASDQIHYFASLEDIPRILAHLLNWPGDSPATSTSERKEG